MEDHSILCHREGGFGPRFTFEIQSAGEQQSCIRVYICVCVCGSLFFSTWKVGSSDSCYCYRFIVCVHMCVCLYILGVCVLFFVFGDYQSGQRLLGVCMEKLGLQWKNKSLPGICSASLWRLELCAGCCGGANRETTSICHVIFFVFDQHMEKLFFIFLKHKEHSFQSSVTPTLSKETEQKCVLIYWQTVSCEPCSGCSERRSLLGWCW